LNFQLYAPSIQNTIRNFVLKITFFYVSSVFDIRYTIYFSSNVLKVFNCTSGAINPVTWGQMRVLLMHYSLTMPSKYVQWYPHVTIRMNQFMHSAHERVCQYLPALLADSILPLIGYKAG